MKKKAGNILAICVLCAGLALAQTGCAADGGAGTDSETAADNTPETETSAADGGEIVRTEEETESAETSDQEFTFADLAWWRFTFASGAGGWSTSLEIHADGSFTGNYHDSELGSTGEGYPDGTLYYCDFEGQFSDLARVDEYTYSMRVADLTYENEVGTEEIKDEILYVYSEAYGLCGADEILIYLPGTPADTLPQGFLDWVDLDWLLYDYDEAKKETATALTFYGLYNAAEEDGFYSEDRLETAGEEVEWAESMETDYRKCIQEAETQTEMNENAALLYEQWDYALNWIWDDLKAVLDGDGFAALLEEQRAWIAGKEEAVAEAGAAEEGGSMQPFDESLKAAELTRERVYELLDVLREAKAAEE